MKHLLLQWTSKNHGLIVALQSVHALSKKEIEIEDVWLLVSTNLNELESAELTIYEEQKAKSLESYLSEFEDEEKRIKDIYRLRKMLKMVNCLPKINPKRLHLNSVTDYQSIYDEMRQFLKKMPSNIQLHINVSPGTPQMHTVWLMLNSSGYLPPNVKIWSSQLNKEKQEHYFNEITFKPKTYLSKVFEAAYKKKHEIRINPNDTLSPKRKEAESRLELFASMYDTPILILGERGVGKTSYVEQFIKNIHYKNKQFKSLPCGIFSEDLMRSELFGYEKGAFTGAEKKKEGILSQFKNGGLLFLDEIHDLSKSLQRQLMQVLQSKEFLPIGGNHLEETNFRLVTASNLSFVQLCEKLSPDFLDRIAGYIVEIPPIRECSDDIIRYWEDTWNSIADRELKDSEKLHQFLKTYSFEGNFRELQRLASYLFAFLISNIPQKEAIDLAIQETEKWQIKKIQNLEDRYFHRGKTYDEIVNQFNKDLTDWAVKEYGTRKEAIQHLKMSSPWFSNAINGKSRK